MSRPDALATVLRLRQSTLDETQRAVAAAYRAERDACALVEAASQALDTESNAAMDLSRGDEAVENYVRWLPIGRRAVERAHDAHRTATVELDRARALLALARAGVRAVESQIEVLRLERAARAARRDQHDADEMGRMAHLGRVARDG